MTEMNGIERVSVLVSSFRLFEAQGSEIRSQNNWACFVTKPQLSLAIVCILEHDEERGI